MMKKKKLWVMEMETKVGMEEKWEDRTDRRKGRQRCDDYIEK